MQSDHVTSEQLSALLDGELSDAEHSIVEEHLSVCTPCRGELEQLRETVMMLRSVPQPLPPRSFALGDEDLQVGTVVLRRGVHPEWLRALAGVAAGLMVILFVADALRAGLGSPVASSLAVRAPAAAPAGGAAGAFAPAPPVAPAAESQDRAPATAERAAPAASAAEPQTGAAPAPPPLGPEDQAAARTPALPQPALRAGDRAVVETAPATRNADATRPSMDFAAPADGSLPEPGRPPVEAPASRPEPGPSPGQMAAAALGVVAALLLVSSFLLPRRSR